MQSKPDALLVVGMLFARDEAYHKAISLLAGCFGEILSESSPRPWSHSTHYERELGGPVIRRFVFFRKLVAQDSLQDIKHTTIGLEAELSCAGRRSVNLDPGYLTQAKLVLASTKDYSHRIMLGRGIFGEVALSFRNGSFRPYHYTYADYSDEYGTGVFNDAREALNRILSQRGSAR